MGKILAIDLGTTYFKFTLFDRGGRLCATHRLASPAVVPAAGRMELPADVFATTIAEGIAQVRYLAGGKMEDAEAVTFATQTNSFVLLDANAYPLTPIILWPDGRAKELESEYSRRFGIPGFSATTGISQADFQFTPAKLLWLQKSSPEIWKRMDKFFLISDYLTYLLTGQHVTEAGAAGLTGLLDIHGCRWWSEVLDQFELKDGSLPAVVRAGTCLGTITPSAAQRFGLPTSCRLIVGCLDQYAGAIGAGNIEPGMISETTGTVLATVCCADRAAVELGPGVFEGPAFREGLYWRMAFGDVSANYLEWYRDQLPDRPDFERLTALAGQIEPGAEGLRLRIGGGLTGPKDVFEGLTPRHGTGHQVRCIMEAVAVALREQIAVLAGDSMPQDVRCAGGAARSELWLQIKTDVMGIDTVATACPEPTSLGAAILAEASLSVTDIRQVARQWVRLQPPHHPDRERHRQYQTIFPRMR